MTATPPTLPAPCSEDEEIAAQPLGETHEQSIAQALLLAAVDEQGIELDQPAGESFAAAAQVPELAGTLTRPRYYPPADRSSQWFADTWQYRTFTFLRLLCIHTTETSGPPSYQGGGTAPNLTAIPDLAAKRLRWRQHFGCDMSSRSLRNPAGGVDTNTTNVLQVELVGTSAKGGPGVFWPDAPDWLILELARFVVWLRDTWGVRAVSTVKWESYPGSYGTSNGVRLSGAAWMAYRGLLAHEHVPENDHGDCGAFPVARLFAAVQSLDAEKDDDMSAADVAAIKAYIDKKADEIVDRAAVAAAIEVWQHGIVRAWDGQASPAGAVLSSTNRYSIEGGWAGKRPPGNGQAGTPTLAQQLLDASTDDTQQPQQ